MREKQDTDIRERLRQKRVLVLGPESEMKQKFLQVFGRMAGEISGDENDMSPEDYVILFGFADPAFAKEDFPASSFEKEAGSFREKGKTDGQKESQAGGWENFSSLTGTLRRLGEVRPAAALLVSRADVYGKLFGEFHPVKEDELGYVCHIAMWDQEAARLRTLEHLCGRMAREDKAAVKIARFPYEGAARETEQKAGKSAEAETGAEVGIGAEAELRTEAGISPNAERKSGAPCWDWERIVHAAVKVLLDGTAGEAYNVTYQREGRPAAADTSALEPIRIVPDTGKAGKLE